MRKSYVALLKKLQREKQEIERAAATIQPASSAAAPRPVSLAEIILQMPIEELVQKLRGVLLVVVNYGGKDSREAIKARLRVDDIGFRRILERELKEDRLALWIENSFTP